MKTNELVLVQLALELLSDALDASYEEIVECLEKRLISEEEASQILESLK